MEYPPECPVCMEICPKEDSFRPYLCNHVYHKQCSQKLAGSHYDSTKSCLLCMKGPRLYKQDLHGIDYTFNNMLEGERDFDLNQYIKKWNKPKCISDNHKFEFETMGEWDFDWVNNKCCERFTYKSMLLTCKSCDTYITI